MGHSWPLFLQFCLFYLYVQLVDKTSPMLGFEPRTFGVGSDRSTNWATSAAPSFKIILPQQLPASLFQTSAS